MKKIFILIDFLCNLISSSAALADTGCKFLNAEYIPDPKDPRPKRDYYQYTITVMPNKHPRSLADTLKDFFVLSIIDPSTKNTVTKLKMKYVSDMSAVPFDELEISKTESIEVEFLNEDFGPADLYRSDEAPAYMVLPESYAKFLNLADDNGLDVEYLSDKKVKPGARVNDHLELIPDTWVFNKCLK